jgi:hypothetical protein
MTPGKMNAVLETGSAGEALASNEGLGSVSRERPLTERAKYEIDFRRIRTALQYAVELLKDVAVLLTILYSLGAVAICVAILFYTFCR